MPRPAESVIVVLPAPAALPSSSASSKQKLTAFAPLRPSDRRVASRRWHAVCDVVAKMVVLPVVCVSVCSAVGLILSLECMEKLPRLPSSWRSIGSVIVRIWGPASAPRSLSSSSLSPSLGAAGAPLATLAHHTSASRRQLHHQHRYPSHKHGSAPRRRQSRAKDEATDDDTARRPLKKQRSRDDRASSSSSDDGFASLSTSDVVSITTRSTCPLESGPLVHKASSLSTSVEPQPVLRKRRVFIWDLDETLVLFASLYNGAFATQHGKEIAAGVRLGEQMMTFMLAMLERHFFFNDLHDADIDHIHCVQPVSSATAAPVVDPTDGVAARYERIREIYEREGAVDFLSDRHSEWFAIREALVAAIDAFSTGWLREARHVLELLTTSASRKPAMCATATTAAAAHSNSNYKHSNAPVVEYENVNLLVTNTQLAPALCKCLIYQLDAYFPIESVYSSSKLHKQHCFEQILREYAGENVEFVAVGDGAEEEYVSHALGIQFHKIRSLADLQQLRANLELEAAVSACPSL